MIDLNSADRVGKVTGSVLDLNSPASGAVENDPQAAPAPVLSSRSPVPRSVSGRPEIEALVLEVGLSHAGHPALRQVDLNARQWLALFRANIAIESAFDVAARSDEGAIGLGQLMPNTARTLGVDPEDPAQNLDGSARYLLAQLQRFGSPDLALAAYNAGPEAVARFGGIPPYPETRAHVRKVMALYAQLSGENT
ncbi:MAG: lytic transglycosylase domain-containing protein [Marinovum algicola]|uniref:lytic transglycosylase domain-containing protein n=1 Tax=Alphaproteobacteria TaxID=28211 RepID=UPI0032EC7888